MFRSLLPALALACCAPAFAQIDQPDGTLLSSQPCPPNPIRDHATYEQAFRAELAAEATLAAAEGLRMPPIGEERIRAALETPTKVRARLEFEGFECRVITYASGGLRIAGLLWKPRDTSGPPRPLLIALRGGNNQFGAMEPWRYWGWHEFLRAGYVVLATQYRGGPGSDGRDGFGSPGDLQDVRNLVPLARSLGYVDTSRVFMHGGSRGGMQAYMLARAGMQLNAMATRAGAANLRNSKRQRVLEEQKGLMTDFPAEGEAAIDRRSAALWAQEIRVPTILFHGTDDWRSPVEDSLAVAFGLRRSGTPFEAHLYHGDTHAIDLNQPDMIARTIDFFHRFGGPPRRP